MAFDGDIAETRIARFKLRRPMALRTPNCEKLIHEDGWTYYARFKCVDYHIWDNDCWGSVFERVP